MLKNVLFFLVLLLSVSGFSQNTLIPDPNFEQALIDLGFDSAPINGSIPTINTKNVTFLDLSSKNISNLTGIQEFTDLNILNCSENQLTQIDVSNNLNLTQLFVDENQLTNVDVTKNLLLQIFWCDQNQINSLDVTNNTELISLDCGDNQLTSLNISNNKRLNVLLCDRNKLTSLDISENINLDRVICDYNFLTSIDTSNNLDLSIFYAGDNLITHFDLSKNLKLKRFWCTRNKLEGLDVTKNIDLEYLTFGDNIISYIDLSNNTKLIRIWGAKNRLLSLDTSNNPELKDLSVSINNLTSLDLSKNTKLERFNAIENSLCYINIKNGNNRIISNFNTISNPNLSCIFVDNVAYSSTNWTKVDSFSNFVLSETECNDLGLGIPEVDQLNDFTGTSFTLPILINGNYYTETNGNGMPLFAGDVISTSQTIYIYNSSLCYSNESSFFVLISNNDYFIPKYFTPNNDSSHDTWKVIDNTGVFTSINIYNRYGKLLKSLLPGNLEWDGTFNGNLLNTDDYWFVIYRGSDTPIKGHFTLKR